MIKDRLNDPDSADFLDPRQATVSESGGGVYIVRRAVRANNVFGGKVLSVWECRLRAEGGDWVAESIREL